MTAWLLCDAQKNPFYIYRAIDIQALIGTIGGYIGLFLGYSVLQIPNAIIFLIKKIRKWFSERRFKRKLNECVSTHPSIEKIPSSRAHFVKGYGCERNNSDTDNVILLPEDKIVQIIEKIVEVKMTKN